MADITGYIGPNQSSGTYGWFELSWDFPNINTSIESLVADLITFGWTQPTLLDSDLDGTLASGQISAYLWPYHATPGGPSCVPDIIGGALVGTFDSNAYVFYDPHALPPDSIPFGTIDGFTIIPVACGTSADGTLQAFISLVSSNSRWAFSAPNYSSATDVVTAIAYHTGPGSNVDSYSAAGLWAPSVDYWAGGQAPTGGGWNVYSTPAPTTGDQIRIRIYERNVGGIFGAFDIQMPWQIQQPLLGDGSMMTGSPASSVWDITTPGLVHVVAGVSFQDGDPVTLATADPHGFKVGDFIYTPGVTGITALTGAFPVIEVISTTEVALGAIVTYEFAPTTFNVGAGPYQIVTGVVPDAPGAEVGNTNLIVSCLNVPGAVGPTSVNITDMINLYGSVPVLITTDGPHDLTIQDRVLVTGVLGATHANGPWWVSRIPAPDQLQLSLDPLVFVFGTGATWSGGGTTEDSTTPGGLLNITAIQNDVTDPIRITTDVPHLFQVGDLIGIAGAGGLSFLTGQWTCAEVLSPTQFEIANEDLGMLIGDGIPYTSGGTVTNGVFNAIIATTQFNGLNTPSSLYDDGQGTMVAVQGVLGFFPSNDRTLAHYSVALPVPMTGTQGDGETTALKPLIMAPYVLTRIAQNQESRIAGTLWDSYMQLQNTPYGTIETYQGVKFFAWAFQEGSFFNATLWIRAESI